MCAFIKAHSDYSSHPAAQHSLRNEYPQDSEQNPPPRTYYQPTSDKKY